ncbi:hypothetical protein ACO2FA_13160 [Staphylococcus warneri]|jgi:hypothetical protein
MSILNIKHQKQQEVRRRINNLYTWIDWLKEDLKFGFSDNPNKDKKQLNDYIEELKLYEISYPQYIEKYQLVKNDPSLLSSFIDLGMTSSSKNFSV